MNKYLLKSVFSVSTVLLLVCFLSHNVHAQTKDSLLRVYNNETIHTYGRFYVKGSRQLKLGDLKPEFKAGITRDLYKKSRGNLLLSKVFTVTAVAALVTGAIIKKDNKGGAIALSVVGIGLNLGSIHLRKRSSELIGRAIWLRNKEILFDVQ